MASKDIPDQDILELLETWFLALKNYKNPDHVTELYARDAILVPTLWNGPCFGHRAIRNYFEAAFLPAHPEGYLINYAINRAGDVVINSGHYVFEINDPEAEEKHENCYNKDGRSKYRIKKPARYTFIYRKDGDKWLITAHHSSKMPEEHSAKAFKWIKSDCLSS